MQASNLNYSLFACFGSFILYMIYLSILKINIQNYDCA